MKKLLALALALVLVLPLSAVAQTILTPTGGGTGWGNPGGVKAGSILVGNGLSKMATSSSFQYSTALERFTATNASSTALTVSGSLYLSGLTSCTEALETDSSGKIVCGTDATSAGTANDFTWATNYGVLSAATTSPLWAQNGIFASTTSHFVYASTTALTVSGTAFLSTLNIGNDSITEFVGTGLALSGSTLVNDGVTSLSGTAPIVNNQSTGAVSLTCNVASGTQVGCLSAANWLTFNNKVGTSSSATAGEIAYFTTTSGSPALISGVATGTVSAGTGISLDSAVRSVIGGALQIAINLSANLAWLGAHDFGGATSVEIPNGTGPTVDATGEIAWDTTDDQLLVATTTGATPAVYPKTQKLWGRTIASTSVDFISGGRIPLSQLRDGARITEIHCFVDGGTSVVINLDTLAGGANTDTVTCDSDGQSDTAMSANFDYTALGLWASEFGTITGAVDYVTFSVWGTWVRE